MSKLSYVIGCHLSSVPKARQVIIDMRPRQRETRSCIHTERNCATDACLAGSVVAD